MSPSSPIAGLSRWGRSRSHSAAARSRGSAWRVSPSTAAWTHPSARAEVITNVPGTSSDVAAGEAIQPDGKIVAVGTASVVAPDGSILGDIALTRFNADGSVDTSFGTNGSVLTNFGDGSIQAIAAAIAPGGKIVVVGTLTNGEFVQEIVLARYNKDGSLDTSFGTGGEVLTSFGDDTSATASGVAVDPNGRIVVGVGTVSGFDAADNFFQDFALVRYSASGKLDASFGTGGEVLTSFGDDTSATAAGVAIVPGGKVVVAGSITDPDTFNNDFAVARYNSNGQLDAGFGSGGEVTTSFGPNTSATAVGVALQPDGKIVVAGTVRRGFRASSFTLAAYVGLKRYNTDGKALDAMFGTRLAIGRPPASARRLSGSPRAWPSSPTARSWWPVRSRISARASPRGVRAGALATSQPASSTPASAIRRSSVNSTSSSPGPNVSASAAKGVAIGLDGDIIAGRGADHRRRTSNRHWRSPRTSGRKGKGQT